MILQNGIIFLISFSNCSLLLARNTPGFICCNFAECICSNSVCVCVCVCVCVWSFPRYKIMSSVTRDILCLLSNLDDFHFFSYLAVLSSTSSWIQVVREVIIALLLKGKAFNFSLSSMILIVDFSYISSIMLRQFPSIPSSLSVFIKKKGCQILSDAFFCISWNDHMAFVLYVVIFNDFPMLNHPCVPGTNSTWS